MKALLFILITSGSTAWAGVPPCEIQTNAVYTTRTTEIKQNGLTGVLVSPVECAPVHAILVLGGSEGGIPARSAAEMAQRGLIAFGLAYFGLEGMKPNIDLLPLEHFAQGIDELRSLAPGAKCCAVIGGSKGSEAALAFAAYLRVPLKGVILISGSSSAFEGFAERATTKASSWTVGGQPIPYTPYVELDQKAMAEMFPQGYTKPPVLLPLYRASILGPEGPRGLLPIENVQSPILFLSGADDQMWPAAQMSETAVSRARLLGFKFDIEHVSYPETGHLLPDGELVLGRDEYYPIQFGGTVEGSARSTPLVRAKIAEFLKRSFSVN